MADQVLITVTQIPDNVSVAIDESRDVVSVAVSNEAGPSGPGVAAGGSVGQVLKKTGTDDFETGWLTVGTACTKDTGTSEGNVPILGTGGKLADSVIPEIALTKYLGVVANESAMVALVGGYGDWCVRSDQGKVYVVTGSPSSSAGNWTALTYPADAVLSVAGKTGTVTLVSADITDATSDGAANTEKVLKTTNTGVLVVSDLFTSKISINNGENNILDVFGTGISGLKNINWPNGTSRTIALCASADGAIAASDVSGLGSLATASSVASTQISDATTTGKSLLTAATAKAARTTLSVDKLFAYCTADEARSPGAYSDSGYLTVSLATGTTYEVEALLIYKVAATGADTAGFSAVFYGPNVEGTNGDTFGGAIQYGVNNFSVTANVGYFSTNIVAAISATGTATQRCCLVKFAITTTGAGSLRLNWSNTGAHSTGTSTATLVKGSWLRASPQVAIA